MKPGLEEYDKASGLYDALRWLNAHSTEWVPDGSGRVVVAEGRHRTTTTLERVLRRWVGLGEDRLPQATLARVCEETRLAASQLGIRFRLVRGDAIPREYARGYVRSCMTGAASVAWYAGRSDVGLVHAYSLDGQGHERPLGRALLWVLEGLCPVVGRPGYLEYRRFFYLDRVYAVSPYVVRAYRAYATRHGWFTYYDFGVTIAACPKSIEGDEQLPYLDSFRAEGAELVFVHNSYNSYDCDGEEWASFETEEVVRHSYTVERRPDSSPAYSPTERAYVARRVVSYLVAKGDEEEYYSACPYCGEQFGVGRNLG